MEMLFNCGLCTNKEQIKLTLNVVHFITMTVVEYYFVVMFVKLKLCLYTQFKAFSFSLYNYDLENFPEIPILIQSGY